MSQGNAIIHQTPEGPRCVLYASGAHCHWCRTHADEAGFPLECPHGLTSATAATRERRQGPGSHLKTLLAAAPFWFQPEARCKCLALAAEMNLNGPAWCRANVERIIDQMAAEYARRANLRSTPLAFRLTPFIRVVARRLILAAIRRAERP